jgi:hypothetical protein
MLGVVVARRRAAARQSFAEEGASSWPGFLVLAIHVLLLS